MNLSDIGEFGLINRYAPKFSSLVNKKFIGIGDDCAVIPINQTDSFCISTDLLIEDIHFVKNKITPEELGYKSLAVNLSDLAAMGAKPVASFLSIGIPANTSVEFIDKFMNGYKQLSVKYNTPLMGGDTTKSVDKLVVNVVVIGEMPSKLVRLRSMAKAGDLICVTGNLGDSAGGLKAILNIENHSVYKTLVRKHHKPEPKINEGLWLANQPEVHAMMDISDGLSSDLMHILKASKKRASVDIDKIHISNSLKKACKEQNWDKFQLAISGGEDYELLVTIANKDFEAFNNNYKKQFNKNLYPVGKIETGKPKISYYYNHKPFDLQQIGFDHFGEK